MLVWYAQELQSSCVIKGRGAWRRGKGRRVMVPPTGRDGTRHRVDRRSPLTHFRIKGSALIVPLNRGYFMAEIGQDGKEQIFPWGRSGCAASGYTGLHEH